jgi:hypothetical protein
MTIETARSGFHHCGMSGWAIDFSGYGVGGFAQRSPEAQQDRLPMPNLKPEVARLAPNPSINRASNGLRPLAAGYVKR